MRRRSWIATLPDIEPTTLLRRSIAGPTEIWAFFLDHKSTEPPVPQHEGP